MNDTFVKFGYPATLLKDYRHWAVLLRPAQVTLGALILGAKSDMRSFADLPREAFAELADVTAGIERTLRRFRPFDRINYLMLMMVDPHVHFHVLPRYASPQEFRGQSFNDAGWPGPPDLKSVNQTSDDLRGQLRQALVDGWQGR